MKSTQLSSRALAVVATLLLIVIVYGVFQPLILRLDGVNQGEDLKVADIISILIAVMALLTSSVGFLIYQFTTRALEDKVAGEVATAREDLEKEIASARDDLRRESEENLALAVVTQRSGAVVDAWQRLLPSLSEDRDGCHPENWPGHLIDSGLRAARVAGLWLPRVADAKKAPLVQGVALNEAFFIACYFLHLTAKGIDPLERSVDSTRALALVEPYESLDRTGDGYRDEETVTWVLLCCLTDEPARRAAKDRAIAMFAVPPASLDRQEWIDITRQRYINAFGETFFDDGAQLEQTPPRSGRSRRRTQS